MRTDALWPNSPNWVSLVPLFRKFWHSVFSLLSLTLEHLKHQQFSFSNANDYVFQIYLESWFWTSWSYVIWEQARILYNFMNVDKYFSQKWPFSGTEKWHLGCPNKNSETTFISPTSPKNDGITYGFKRLPLLVGFKAHFLASPDALEVIVVSDSLTHSLTDR